MVNEAGSFGLFNLFWQLLAQEVPSPNDRADGTQRGGESSSGADDTLTEKRGSDAKPGSLDCPPVSTPAAVATIAEEREPSIAEMFFAAPFQTIIWSHSIKDLIDVFTPPINSLEPLRSQVSGTHTRCWLGQVHTFQNWAPTFLHLQHNVPLGRVGAYFFQPIWFGCLSVCLVVCLCVAY